MSIKHSMRVVGSWLSGLSIAPLIAMLFLSATLAYYARQDGMTTVFYQGNHTNWKYYYFGRDILEMMFVAVFWGLGLSGVGFLLGREKRAKWLLGVSVMLLVVLFFLHAALID